MGFEAFKEMWAGKVWEAALLSTQFSNSFSMCVCTCTCVCVCPLYTLSTIVLTGRSNKVIVIIPECPSG